MPYFTLVRAAALAVAVVLALSARVGAAERTGEVLRELLRGVEQDFERLEKETAGFPARRAELTRTLEDKHRAFLAESNPARQQFLRAEAYAAAAQLNTQDLHEVELTLRTIAGIRDKVGRIRGVLEDGGILPRQEERARFQMRLANWGRSAARLLDRLSERGGPETKAEIEALKRSLSGTFGAWEMPAGRGGGDEDLQRTVRALDVMHSQFINVQRALEMEKTQLQLRNQQALLDLIVLRLTEGGTNVRSLGEAAGAKQREIQQRQRLVDDLDGGMGAAGIGSTGARGLRGDDAERFERIKRGFDFGGKR